MRPAMVRIVALLDAALVVASPMARAQIYPSRQSTYASAAMRSINQISTEQIALSAGVKRMHVPYKGRAPALNDLVGGHVDMFLSSIPQALQPVRSGQIKTLAVTSPKRSKVLPDIPTLKESGESEANLG